MHEGQVDPLGGDLLRRRALGAQLAHTGARHIGAVRRRERAIGGGAGVHVAFRLRRGGRRGRRVELRGGSGGAAGGGRGGRGPKTTPRAPRPAGPRPRPRAPRKRRGTISSGRRARAAWPSLPRGSWRVPGQCNPRTTPNTPRACGWPACRSEARGLPAYALSADHDHPAIAVIERIAFEVRNIVTRQRSDGPLDLAQFGIFAQPARRWFRSGLAPLCRCARRLRRLDAKLPQAFERLVGAIRCAERLVGAGALDVCIAGLVSNFGLVNQSSSKRMPPIETNITAM